MTRDEIDLLVNMIKARGRDVSAGDVALALTEVHVDEVRSASAQRVSWRVWDKQTPINDVEPSYFLNRVDYGGGEIYLVELDGAVVMVQPHQPNVPGIEPIDVDEVESLAQAQVQLMVDDLATSVLAEFVSALIPAGQLPQSIVPQLPIPGPPRDGEFQ